jgi:hypothetical protein
MDFDALVRKHLRGLAPAAQAVAGSGGFSLALPCGLLSEDDAICTSLAGLRGHLPCSMALSSPAIEQFLSLKEEVGFDSAFAECSSDNEDGREFCQAWDECQADLARGVLVTLNDLVAMVEQAREGWKRNPKQLLVVAVTGSTVRSGLVPTDLLSR